jgi:crossover junction endodeoxyribonuclease RuvC
LLVLGIDPGTQRVGYGLIRSEANRFCSVTSGRIEIEKELLFPNRLNRIYHDVLDLLDQNRPDVVAVEEVYVTSNAKTTLRLGHARGVILLAAVERGIPVAEYAPREIKQAVVGNGAAGKGQVEYMIRQILDLGRKNLTEDESDALAVALCHGMRTANPMVQAAFSGKRT